MGIQFQRVAIVGVGLIGGSLGLFLRQKGLAHSIVGVGRRKENLERAVTIGAIDRYVSQGKEAIEEADLVVLATPVGTYETHVREWKSWLRPSTIVMDVGSVKGKLVEQLENLMPETVRFVGTHPIAGGEKSGVAFSRPDLFQGARCIVTPTSRTDPKALEIVRHLWEAAGSVVMSMDPLTHDWVFSAVSHLPHVASFSLMQALREIQRQTSMPIDLLNFSGGGLKDTTRIAASSPEMWRDICLANDQNLIQMIDIYTQCLQHFKTLLETNDRGELEKELKRAKETREQLG